MNDYYNLTIDEQRKLEDKHYKRKHNRRSRVLEDYLNI